MLSAELVEKIGYCGVLRQTNDEPSIAINRSQAGAQANINIHPSLSHNAILSGR
jgi:hypothetical protein